MLDMEHELFVEMLNAEQMIDAVIKSLGNSCNFVLWARFRVNRYNLLQRLVGVVAHTCRAYL